MGFADVFVLGMILGGLFELIYAELHAKLTGKRLKRNHRFTIAKKISLLSIPIWGVIALLAFHYTDYIRLVVIVGVIGASLEYLTGLTFYKVYGIKLWTYHKGAIGQYTSIYAIPYWGGAGILFLLLGRLTGL